MSHSLNKIWIHAIWATKERKPLINPAIEKKVHTLLQEQLGEMGCSVKIINGMPEHVHCLFLLNSQKSISEVIKQAKGSSSHFINRNNLLAQNFAWQTGYAAYSVSEMAIKIVYDYIQNQKRHHEKRSFEQEYQEFENMKPRI